MHISKEQALDLCRNLADSLAKWGALDSALQSGGLEEKATGIIIAQLEAVAKNENLLVLPEYKKIDYAFIVRNHSHSRLNVDTVIEVKFNYASQLNEIRNRLPSAINQANGYQQTVSAKNAYVVYIIAAPYVDNLPPHPRDSGWGYWNRPMIDAIKIVQQSTEQGTNELLLGDAQTEENPQLYCALFECSPSVPKSGTLELNSKLIR